MRRKLVLSGLITVGLIMAAFLAVVHFSPIKVFATQLTGLSGPRGVAIGDYNNDGLNELAVAEYGAGKVTVYKSDGVTVVKQWTGLAGPYGVAIGDYNNDGVNDLAFTEMDGNRVTVYNSGGAIIKQWTGLNSPGDVAIGAYDYGVANNLAFTEYLNGTADKVTVYSSDGSNTISKQLTGLQNSWGVCIGDLNNDCVNDLAFSEAGAGKVTIYYQTKTLFGSISLNSSRSNVY